MDDYKFPSVEDAKLAKQIYQRMKLWLPFQIEGEADCFCIDCDSPEGAVVYHQHDWYDGGSGENGHVLASSLGAFLQSWGRVCFASPANLYWPSAFARKGVNWTSRYFPKAYIIKD